jgi:adenosylhomocysteinase
MVEAYKDGCIPVNKEALLSGSHLVFCATGSQSIANAEFFKLRPGCYVVSVTSSEDEFDLRDIITKFKVTSENEFVKKLSNANTHWYLVNDGNAVNFIERNGDRVGDFIRLVQGEIIIALESLIKGGLSSGLQDVSQDKRKDIARVFLDHYLNS